MTLTKAIEAARKALGYYAQETMYEEQRVYRGEPMSEAYQVDVYPIIEGEKYHTAQDALAALPDKPMTEEELLQVVIDYWNTHQELHGTAMKEGWSGLFSMAILALKAANVLYVED